MVAHAEVLQPRTDQLRRQLPVGCRDRHQGAPRQASGRPALVHVDMRGLGAEDAIEGAGHRLQGHGVRPRAVEKEEGRGALAKHLPYLGGSRLRPRIVAIPYRVIVIRLDNRIHYPGMHAGIIVTRETSHNHQIFNAREITDFNRERTQGTKKKYPRRITSAEIHALNI